MFDFDILFYYNYNIFTLNKLFPLLSKILNLKYLQLLKFQIYICLFCNNCTFKIFIAVQYINSNLVKFYQLIPFIFHTTICYKRNCEKDFIHHKEPIKSNITNKIFYVLPENSYVSSTILVVCFPFLSYLISLIIQMKYVLQFLENIWL